MLQFWGRKRRASSSEAELRAANQEKQPGCWGWAQAVLRPFHRGIDKTLAFGAVTLATVASSAAQTLRVVETSDSAASGDIRVKRRAVDRGEEVSVVWRATPWEHIGEEKLRGIFNHIRWLADVAARCKTTHYKLDREFRSGDALPSACDCSDAAEEHALVLSLDVHNWTMQKFGRNTHVEWTASDKAYREGLRLVLAYAEQLYEQLGFAEARRSRSAAEPYLAVTGREAEELDAAMEFLEFQTKAAPTMDVEAALGKLVADFGSVRRGQPAASHVKVEPAAAAGRAPHPPGRVSTVEDAVAAGPPPSQTWLRTPTAAARRPPVSSPSGFRPQHRKTSTRRQPAATGATRPPLAEPAATPGRAAAATENHTLVLPQPRPRPAAAAAFLRPRPTVAELKRLRICAPVREVASRPLHQRAPLSSRLPDDSKAPPLPLKGILKKRHPAALLRRHERVETPTARRRVAFRSSPLSSPASSVLFNWRGHFAVPSPTSSTSSDGEPEVPRCAGLAVAPAPDHPRDVTSASQSALGFARPPAHPESSPLAPPCVRQVAETHQPAVSASPQAQDAPQTRCAAPAMDPSRTINATKRPPDATRLAQTPMRQAPARTWNHGIHGFQTPQPARADMHAKNRVLSGSSSRLPAKLFRPGTMASQRASTQTQGPAPTATDTRAAASSSSTPRPAAFDMPGSFPSAAPDGADVDMAGNSSDARSGFSSMPPPSTRKSRFRPPSHGTATPRKKSIDVPDFSLIESPEPKAPPTPETKSPQAIRKEMLDFFDDPTRDLRYPGAEDGRKEDSNGKAQQSPTDASPARPPPPHNHSPARSHASSSPTSSQPDSPHAPSHSASPSPLASPKPEDDLDFPSFPALTISADKDDELACAVQLRIEAEEEAERERVRRAEEERRREEEERREREEKERLERSGGLRLPRAAVVQQVPEDWQAKIMDTLRTRETTALAKSAEGTEILGRDFRQVVPPTVWLNDEIVNSSLSYVAKYVNEKTGGKNAVKCVLLNSFFWKHLNDRGPESTQRWLRRLGVNQANYLSVETFLLPINLGNAHWTLGIVRPKQGFVAHIDSLGPQGAGSPQIAGVLLRWVKTFLGPRFDESHWRVRDYVSPRQTNGWDCGVHSITNGFCIALDIDPSTYEPGDMPMQRLRLAGMLLNGGFTGDFDISDL